MTTDQLSRQISKENAAWIYDILKIARESAEKALASPYQESTTKLRNLLLGSSAGLGLWLLGMKVIEVHPLGKLIADIRPILFHLLATVVQVYALLAYELAAAIDMEIHRHKVLEPQQRMTDEVRKMQSQIQKHLKDMSEAEDRREPVLRELEETFTRREACYSKIRQKIDSRLYADPNNSDFELDYELWRKVSERQERMRKAHTEKVNSAWSGIQAEREFSFRVKAEMDILDSLTSKSSKLKSRRAFASTLERYGALLIGVGVLLWSIVVGILKVSLP